MFKRILVAVDGSPTSYRGLKVALGVAKEHGATLYALHVVDDMAVVQGFYGTGYVPPDYVDGLIGRMREVGRKALAKAADAARKVDQSIEPVLVESRGQSVAHAVLREARRLRADLIVLGTHGRRGLTRLVMGSDAEGIVREARVPVLLVRSPMASHASRTVEPKLESLLRPERERAARPVRSGAARRPPAGKAR
jgi:nucleotide-binding universal stress UspA family protein